MKKNVNSVNLSLNKKKNKSSKKRDSSKSSKEKNHSQRENKKSKNNLLFSKKKLGKNIIPNSNSKCFTIKLKELSKTKKEHISKISKTNNTNVYKKILSDSKSPSLNLIKKNKISPLRLSSKGKITPEKKVTFIKYKNELNLINNNKSINSQRLMENDYPTKTKKISFFKDKLNTCKIENKIIPKDPKKEKCPIYHKKIDKKHKLILINKMKTNIINISSDNLKRNINYYKQREKDILNNKQANRNKEINIDLNNKETEIRNVSYLRSNSNKLISFKNNISPIKKVILIRNRKNKINLNENQVEKIKGSTTFTVSNSDNKLPANYGYHEIIYKNSPKKVGRNKNNNKKKNNNYLKETQNNIYIRNNRPLLEELTSQNNNCKQISTTILINNQSFNNLDNKIIIPYYSTLNSNKNLSLYSNFREENFNTCENICFYTNGNINSPKNNSKLFLSPKINKLEISGISGQYNEIETENEDVQTIHYFGEEMLKKNENYNFAKRKEVYKFPINELNNYELKRNNSLNDLNNCQKKDQKKSFKSIPFSSTYKEYKWRKYNKRNGNNNRDVKINKNNKRFSHNIINRKKKKKLVMEKSLNEQFISQNNKNKTCEYTKDKISCCESSIILDNDSINEIIKEFEKEIENEEKKDNLDKDSCQKKIKINNEENTDVFINSFASDNNNFSMSKGSTNDSKIKKRKVRYYKTKNFEPEKNYDFFISPSRIRNKNK